MLWWWMWCCIATFLSKTISSGGVYGGSATYDGRSLIIDGQHRILFSGSIHYPRSTPQMWPSLIAKAKEGGIDVIQTYVFWSLHEPIQGQYDFSGGKDLIGFIKEIQAQGLYVCLRIGPFIESEWTYGGLPFWLHDVPGIIFRSDNEPFKVNKISMYIYISEFYQFANKIMLKHQSVHIWFMAASHAEIENEYQNVEAAFHEMGPPYVRWAAAMAIGLQTGVPWVMCKQDDAPDPVINACNGLQCGETFAGPNSPNKPAIWTENWVSQYQVYGGEPTLRSAEDIAFQVALFIAKKGSYVNYYMYHGGTNFGRTASAFVTTSYYDQAPLDEYGLIRQPKWGHLKELHAAIKSCSKPIITGTYNNYSIGQEQEAHVYKVNSRECTAFLVNKDEKRDKTVSFQNSTFNLPRKSISILPDCKTIVFNTAKVSMGYNKRSMMTSQAFSSSGKWEEYKETIPNFENTLIRANSLQEHMSTTKDASDYLWHTFSFQQDLADAMSVLNVSSRGHALHAFINGAFIGSAHGSHDDPRFTLQKNVHLNKGTNNVALLSVTVGLPDSGAYLERRAAGLRKVKVQNHDFTNYLWGYQVGLLGEKLQIYTDQGSDKVKWSAYRSSSHQRLTWYKTIFDTPVGNTPVALNLCSMGKGEAWVNGNSIGRYWVSFRTSTGNPAQQWYHIPRSFLKPANNVLILLEEEEGEPLGITIDSVSIT